MIKLSLIKQPNKTTLQSTNYHLPSTTRGFTIVELLVVIVVIGILASITIVSYTGISSKAIVASLQSDLANASQQLKVFQATDASGNYPTAINCPTPGATEVCIKPSGSNSFTGGYTVNNNANPKTFQLTVSNNTTKYRITSDSSPTVATASLADTDPANWLTIGSQVWAKANINVGTMVTGVTAQTNNAILEKYCYADTASNCTTYGGLYQWDEAMQYTNTQGAQGICPAGSHIPSDNDWKILETQLGMSQAQADVTGFRGTDQGTQLKSGGISGLNMLLAGNRNTDGSFGNLPSYADLWSSSESSANAYYRYFYSASAAVGRDAISKADGFSVRCIGN